MCELIKIWTNDSGGYVVCRLLLEAQLLAPLVFFSVEQNGLCKFCRGEYDFFQIWTSGSGEDAINGSLR